MWHLDGPSAHLVEPESDALHERERGTTQTATGISLVDDGIDAHPVVDLLHIVSLEEACQQTGIVLTGKPGVQATVETRGEAIGMTHIVEIQRLAGEGAHQPTEEVVIRLLALVTIAPEFGNEAIGIPSLAYLVQIEDVEERIGHFGSSLSGHTLAGIRAADIDPAFDLCLPCQGQNRIEVGDEAILIDIDGDVAGLVLEHRVEVAIGRLVGEPDAGIARLLVESTTEQVELLVEATAIELDSNVIPHTHIAL